MARMEHLTPRRQQGLALVIVLWVIMLLAIMAGSFAYTLRTDTTLATHATETARGRALAEAGLAHVAYRLLIQPDPESPWPIDGTPRLWTFGSGQVRIAVRDTSGLIDINHADRELFKGLLTTIGGLDEREADILLDRIEDYRDPDDLERIDGAERDTYLQAGYPRGPKNAPFESIEELQQVFGMTAELYRRIADSITVWSQQPGLNPAAASAEMLRAVPGLDADLIDEYIAERELAIEQNEPPPPFPFPSEYLTGGGGMAYHVQLTAWSITGIETGVTATISGRQYVTEAFHIDAWREGVEVRPDSEAGY